MSGLKVYEASAGSGKTYTLTKEYIGLLLKSPHLYKHILAVTFTNKATTEMRLRIIEALYALAKNQISNLSSDFEKQLGLSDIQIRDRAQTALSLILHDYSRFSVETIDKFFLRVIQAFIRELGVHVGFNVELNTQQVMEEAVNRLLERAEHDPNLKKWLLGLSENRILEGKNWNIRHDLLGLGQELFKETFKRYQQVLHQKFQDKDWLKGVIQNLQDYRSDFKKNVKALGVSAIHTMESFQLTVEDFKYKNTGVGGFFQNHANGLIKPPGKRILDAIDNLSVWTQEGSPQEAQIESAYGNGLNKALSDILSLYEQDYILYESYGYVLKYLHTLGLTGEISEEIMQTLQEDNAFLLADASSFIFDIIDGNDTPFIYEKMGVWYHHFMLDEFQDTSFFQWRNFLPLIKNSISEGHQNIIVGDIKQSIYRWRNSNWEILAKFLDQAFAAENLNRIQLEYNWRSAPNIVEFNNIMFASIPKFLDRMVQANGALISDLYIGAKQNTTKNGASIQGSIDIYFDEFDEEVRMEKMRQHIDMLLSHGVPLGEIAILVRNKKEGAKIVQFLSELAIDKNTISYSFVSEDALFLSKSNVVNLVINALRLIVNRADKMARYNLEHFYLKSFDDLDLCEKTIQSFDDVLNDLGGLSLYELVEKISVIFDLNTLEKSLSYLLAFKDLVLETEQRKVANITYFLKWWEEVGQNKVLGVQHELDALQIMTIHKSKGLEFKAVLIPFCDWPLDQPKQLTNLIWTNSQDERLKDIPVFPLKYVNGLEKSVFKDDFFNEQFNAHLDHLNLLYVALTRCRESLFVCATKPKDEKLKTVGHVLHAAIAQEEQLKKLLDNDRFQWGVLRQKQKKKSKTQTSNYRLKSLNSIDYRKQNRLAITTQTIDDLEKVGSESQIDYGKLMHAIFQEIDQENQINRVFTKYRNWIDIHELDYKMLENDVRSYLKVLHDQTWYQSVTDIKSEVELLTDLGEIYRPDKLYLTEEQAIVIDFKFGEKESNQYLKQVQLYKKLVGKILPKIAVMGIVWYVNLGKLEQVKDEPF